MADDETAVTFAAETALEGRGAGIATPVADSIAPAVVAAGKLVDDGAVAAAATPAPAVESVGPTTGAACRGRPWTAGKARTGDGLGTVAAGSRGCPSDANPGAALAAGVGDELGGAVPDVGASSTGGTAGAAGIAELGGGAKGDDATGGAAVDRNVGGIAAAVAGSSSG
jgi:hypothetical protein